MKGSIMKFDEEKTTWIEKIKRHPKLIARIKELVKECNNHYNDNIELKNKIKRLEERLEAKDSIFQITYLDRTEEEIIGKHTNLIEARLDVLYVFGDNNRILAVRFRDEDNPIIKVDLIGEVK